MIQSMIAGESAPAARIAARSMTTPPEACGRDSLATSVVISRSFTAQTVASVGSWSRGGRAARRMRDVPGRLG